MEDRALFAYVEGHLARHFRSILVLQDIKYRDWLTETIRAYVEQSEKVTENAVTSHVEGACSSTQS